MSTVIELSTSEDSLSSFCDILKSKLALSIRYIETTLIIKEEELTQRITCPWRVPQKGSKVTSLAPAFLSLGHVWKGFNQNINFLTQSLFHCCFVLGDGKDLFGRKYFYGFLDTLILRLIANNGYLATYKTMIFHLPLQSILTSQERDTGVKVRVYSGDNISVVVPTSTVFKDIVGNDKQILLRLEREWGEMWQDFRVLIFEDAAIFDRHDLTMDIPIDFSGLVDWSLVIIASCMIGNNENEVRCSKDRDNQPVVRLNR